MDFAEETVSLTVNGYAYVLYRLSLITDDDYFVSSLFGEPNTPYDFTTVNMNEAKPTLRQLEDRYATMRKKVNAKVMNMIERFDMKRLEEFPAIIRDVILRIGLFYGLVLRRRKHRSKTCLHR